MVLIDYTLHPEVGIAHLSIVTHDHPVNIPSSTNQYDILLI